MDHSNLNDRSFSHGTFSSLAKSSLDASGDHQSLLQKAEMYQQTCRDVAYRYFRVQLVQKCLVTPAGGSSTTTDAGAPVASSPDSAAKKAPAPPASAASNSDDPSSSSGRCWEELNQVEETLKYLFDQTPLLKDLLNRMEAKMAPAQPLLPLPIRDGLPLLCNSWQPLGEEGVIELPSPRHCTARRSATGLAKGFGVLFGAQRLRPRTVVVVRKASPLDEEGVQTKDRLRVEDDHGEQVVDPPSSEEQEASVRPPTVSLGDRFAFRVLLRSWEPGNRLDIGVSHVAPTLQKKERHDRGRGPPRYAEDLLSSWIVEASGLLVGSHAGVRTKCAGWDARALQENDVVDCIIDCETGHLALSVNGKLRGVWDAKIRSGGAGRVDNTFGLYPVVDLFENSGSMIEVELLEIP